MIPGVIRGGNPPVGSSAERGDLRRMTASPARPRVREFGLLAELAARDHVAALQQRAHVGEAGLLQQLPQLGHLHPLVTADVDAAQQDHQVAGGHG